MNSRSTRLVLTLLLTILFVSHSVAQDRQGMELKLEPGMVLHYTGTGMLITRPAGEGAAVKEDRTWRVLDSRAFVLSAGENGKALMALTDAVYYPPEERSLSRDDEPSNYCELVIKNRDGSWTASMDCGAMSPTLAKLIMGPETLPKGPLSMGMTWIGNFSYVWKIYRGAWSPDLTYETEFTLVALDDSDGKRTARITTNLAGRKPPAGSDLHENPPIEFRDGSVVEYEVNLETGIARRCRMHLSYRTLWVENKENATGLDVTDDFAFELQPDLLPDPARAALVANAIESFESGDVEEMKDNFRSFKDGVGNSEWRDLAAAWDDFDLEAVLTETIEEREVNPTGPFPKSFDASRITLKMKDCRVSRVLGEIEKQTGNRFPVTKKYYDAAIGDFAADDESYWFVLDRLCGMSGNEYASKTMQVDSDRGWGRRRPVIRAGRLPDCPASVCGPFKAFMTDLVLELDPGTGKREAIFTFLVMAEPKWAGFETLGPAIHFAVDDSGMVGVPAPAGGDPEMTTWSRAKYNCVTDICEGWCRELRAPVSAESKTFREIWVEFPVRYAPPGSVCRFEALKSGSAIGPKIAHETTFEVSRFESSSGQVKITVDMKGNIGDPMNSFRFDVFLTGTDTRFAFLEPRISDCGPGSCRFELDGKLLGEIDDGELDFVISRESMKKRVMFRFENVKIR